LYYTASGIVTLKSEWSNITKTQFYKYEQIVVKFMYEFFVYDYCISLSRNMLCDAEVMFIQLLILLKSYYRVSIKSFPDYKHLLQENYCTWNTNIFFFKM